MDAAPDEDLLLIKRKNRKDALKIQSNSVLKKTKEIDKQLHPIFIRNILPTSHEIRIIPNAVMRKSLQENIFPGMATDHIRQTFIKNNSSHHSLLVKYIIQFYMQVRLANHAKDFNIKVALKGQPSRRHQLHKLGCFLRV